MTDVHFDWVPWATNTTHGGFDERGSKKGAKGALVVVANLPVGAMVISKTVCVVVAVVTFFLR